MKYNPQKTYGKPYCQKSGRMSENWKGGLGTVITDNKDGKRHPKTIQKFVRDKSEQNSQEPRDGVCGCHRGVFRKETVEYFVKTYTNEGDIVLDCCMGSGSTGVACVNTNRNFIGIELDEKYFSIAKERLGV